MKRQRVEYYSPESFQNVNNEGDCNYQCDHSHTSCQELHNRLYARFRI